MFRARGGVTMPSVSVVVPVYNVEDYLPQCMDSIRRQTLSDIEIICVVDGSTDRSESILRLYERVEPRLKIITKENGGLSSARNVGMEAATGQLVMFVDSDDMLTPDACRVVYDEFERAGVEVVTFGAWCYPRFESTPWHEENLAPRNVVYDDFSPDILFKEQSHPFVWRTAVASKLLHRTGLRFDETVKFGEDQIFHFALYPKASGVSFMSDRLYEYRLQRKGSLMATRFADPLTRLSEHIAICDRVCQNWKSDGLMEAYGSDLAFWVGDFLLPYCLRTSDDDRRALVPALRKLFSDHFSSDIIKGIDESSPMKPVCEELIKPSSAEDVPDGIRSAFFEAIDRSNDSEMVGAEPRSALQSKLRTVLPMSAAGMEYRLVNLETRLQQLIEVKETRQTELSAEQLHWVAEEAGACSRSLALLQCELMVKGL